MGTVHFDGTMSVKRYGRREVDQSFSFAGVESFDPTSSSIIESEELMNSGYHGASQEISHLVKAGGEVGYPLLIKPTHGGGGKGMRVVHDPAVLEEEIMIAKREALKSFGNDEVLLERWLERPRHVEVQVFADTQGDVVSLWERDCSVQRRHQSKCESSQREESFWGLTCT